MPDELIPDANDVQPEGQGVESAQQSGGTADPGQGQEDYSGLYDLNSVPTEYRSHVERIAKDIDRNVQAKLREAAEFRKGWEPYESLGLREYDAESVGSLLQLAQALSDEDSAREVVHRLAESLGLSIAEAQSIVDDAEDEDDDPLSDIRGELEELREFKASFEFSRAQEAETQRLTQEFAEVEAQHGKPFTDKERDLLVSMAARFGTEDEPINAAYALMNEISGAAEKALVSGKAKEPAPAESRGRASTTVKRPDSFDEAERLFVESRKSLI